MPWGQVKGAGALTRAVPRDSLDRTSAPSINDVNRAPIRATKSAVGGRLSADARTAAAVSPDRARTGPDDVLLAGAFQR
jgi:hypothetical protein